MLLCLDSVVKFFFKKHRNMDFKILSRILVATSSCQTYQIHLLYYFNKAAAQSNIERQYHYTQFALISSCGSLRTLQLQHNRTVQKSGDNNWCSHFLLQTSVIAWSPIHFTVPIHQWKTCDHEFKDLDANCRSKPCCGELR